MSSGRETEKNLSGKTYGALMSEKEVVVILPHREGKVLMQLRDDRQGIPCAGCWGFFGGAIEQGDIPEDTIWREVFEELGYQPTAIYQLGVGRIRDLGNLLSYAYYCHLTVPVERLHLREGMDLGLFSPAEILSKRLYSARLKKTCPIADTAYIGETIEKLIHRLGGLRSKTRRVDGESLDESIQRPRWIPRATIAAICRGEDR